MIKRETSLFFLFIAGFLLLANVIIPHHHHNSNICFRYSHCTDERTHAKSNHSDHEHDRNDECCSLNSAVILPATQGNENTFFNGYVVSHQNLSDFTAIMPFNNGTDPFLCGFLCDDSPGISSPFSVYIKSSLGLRAPPLV